MILFWTFQKGTFFLGGFLGLALLTSFRGGRLPASFPWALTTCTEILDIFKRKERCISKQKLSWAYMQPPTQEDLGAKRPKHISQIIFISIINWHTLTHITKIHQKKKKKNRHYMNSSNWIPGPPFDSPMSLNRHCGDLTFKEYKQEDLKVREFRFFVGWSMCSQLWGCVCCII